MKEAMYFISPSKFILEKTGYFERIDTPLIINLPIVGMISFKRKGHSTLALTLMN